jgi:hypothetical protein
MQSLTEAALESWDRCSVITSNVVRKLQPDWLEFQTSPAESSIARHLCHLHGVRAGWLAKVAPQFEVGMEALYVREGERWVPMNDLAKIAEQLDISGTQVGKAMAALLSDPQPVGPYSHPLFYMQHMIWHEGWHISSIMQALRANGEELDEEWEEESIWAVWRS